MKSCALFWILGFCSLLQAQLTPVQVTFNFDATPLVTNCMIEPTNGGRIAIGGSMNGWNNTGVDAFTAGVNHQYNITKTLYKKSVGDSIYNYKLIHFPSSTGFIAWEADPNRSLTLTPNTTHQTLNLGAWKGAINNVCVPTGNVEVTFKVNVKAQLLAQNFLPATDKVILAGDFNTWNNGSNPNPTVMQPSLLLAEVYEKKMLFQGIKLGIPQLAFKHVLHRPVQGAAALITWEDGDDRKITIPTLLPDEDGNGIQDYSYSTCFNNLCADKVFPQATTCYLELDARPAFYRLMDAGSLPANLDTGATGISQINGFYVNGVLSRQTPLAWGDGVGQLGQSEAHRLKDDGLNGDLVAGDSVYTKKFDFAAGDLRQYRGKFSANGFDNEAGFAADDIVTYPIGASCRYKTAFGVFGPLANGKLSDNYCSGFQANPYDNYTLLTNAIIPGATLPPYYTTNVQVLRRGGGVDGILCPAIEQVSSDVPQKTTLLAAYPNPFQESVNFSYELKQAEMVTLRIFDVTGREVAVLLKNKSQEAGTYKVDFNAKEWANGTYFYRLETATMQLTKSVILIR